MGRATAHPYDMVCGSEINKLTGSADNDGCAAPAIAFHHGHELHPPLLILGPNIGSLLSGFIPILNRFDDSAEVRMSADLSPIRVAQQELHLVESPVGCVGKPGYGRGHVSFTGICKGETSCACSKARDELQALLVCCDGFIRLLRGIAPLD